MRIIAQFVPSYRDRPNRTHEMPRSKPLELPEGATYIDSGYWELPAGVAKRLCGGTLPKPGYERIVEFGGSKWAIHETPVRGELVWGLRWIKNLESTETEKTAGSAPNKPCPGCGQPGIPNGACKKCHRHIPGKPITSWEGSWAQQEEAKKSKKATCLWELKKVAQDETKEGVVNKIRYTNGGFGEQYTTIDGVEYVTYFDIMDPKLKGLGTGARVRYTSKDGPTRLGGPVSSTLGSARLLEVVGNSPKQAKKSSCLWEKKIAVTEEPMSDEAMKAKWDQAKADMASDPDGLFPNGDEIYWMNVTKRPLQAWRVRDVHIEENGDTLVTKQPYYVNKAFGYEMDKVAGPWTPAEVKKMLGGKSKIAESVRELKKIAQSGKVQS